MKIISLSVLLLATVLPSSDAGILVGKSHEMKASMFWSYMKSLGACYGTDNLYNMMSDVEKEFAPCFGNAMDTQQARNRRDAEQHIIERDNFIDVKESGVPFYSAMKIRWITAEIVSTIKIVNCYFEKLNLTITADGRVDGSSIKNSYQRMRIDPELQNSVIEMIGRCEKDSAHGIYMQYGIKYQEFQKMVHFYRCTERAKVEACVAYDMRNNDQMFDLSGLDGFLEGLDDPTKRWFVTSSFANWDRTGLWDI